MFWFHCGRCGSLFQSKAGEADGRLCTKCGFDPCPGVLDIPEAPAIPVPAPNTESESHSKTHQEKRNTRTRKNPRIMLKLIGGWLVVIALILVGARHLWPEEKSQTTPAKAIAEASGDEEDTVLLNDSIQKCVESFSGFLAAGTPEGRNQFVLSPISTAARMDRFYSLNPSMKIDPTSLELAGRSVVHLPDAKAIATLWKSKDGKQYDAVFQEENGEWRLDWDQFARYGDYPWSLFLAGTGPAEGEFRLLARERLADERKEAATISLMLYAPRFGEPGETGFQSPEFLVSKESPDGQLLDAAFKLVRSGGQVFNPKIPNVNPDGMIRVRLMVRRIETDMERKFEITRVIACHWYSVDDPGVVPAPSAPAED